MRVLIIILTLTLICGSTSAQTLYPFQVLYAENARLKDGRELKSLDMVSVDESIKIENGGSLVLIHDTGFPIEINGDTILFIRELDEIISPKSATLKVRSKKKHYPTQGYSNRRIGIDFIFISDRVTANKRKLSTLGLTFDQNDNMEIIYPPRSRDKVTYSGDFCIRWRPSIGESYNVEIRNMYDDVLANINTKVNEIVISEKEMGQIQNSNTTLLLTITKNPSGVKSQTFAVMKYNFKHVSNPYPCQIFNPSSALLVAFYLETSVWDYTKVAEEYYILAAKLSPKKFYQDMLSNYYSRQAK